MNKKYFAWIFVAFIVVAPIGVYALVTLLESRYQPLPIMGEKGHTVYDFALYDQHGNKQSLKEWDNKIVIAHYFFTHCPAICPKMIYQLKRIQAYAKVENLHIASFSVDPERDSVERLKSFEEQFGITGKWSMLTGDKPQLYRLARKSFLIVATDGDGGPDDFIHSEKLVLIDTKKRIRGLYTGTSESEVNKLINDLKKLRVEQANN